MIGKILADSWGWTKKLGGTENAVANITTKVKDKELRKLKQDIQDCNATAEVDVVVKQHGLSNIEGLPEHIKELYEKGKIGKLNIGDVNKFAINQRYTDIANQAHGIIGVKKAIDEYNAVIKNGTLDTKKFVETISNGNSSLGKYLTGLNGADAGLGRYAASLATATLKTFALQTATMTMNAAVSFGISFAIYGLISLFTDLAEKEERATENAEAFTNSVKEFQSSVAEGSKKIGELSKKYDELSEGVSDMGNNVSLTDEQYEEYKNTISELSDLMPNLNTYFNEHGEAIGFVKGKLEDAKKEYKEYIQLQAQDLLRNGDKDGKKFQSTLDDFKNSNEEDTYGWSNIWRDNLGNLLQGLSLYPIQNAIFGGGGDVDWGSELFGASAEYSVKEQLDILTKLLNKSKDEWSDILNDSSVGDSKEANLVEELLGIDVDEIQTSGDDKFKQIQKILSQKIDVLQRDLNGKAGRITNGMQTMLSSDSDYWSIKDDDMRNAITSMLSGLNYDALTNLNIDLGDQVEIETWVANLVDDIKENKDNVSDAIKSLFKLDTKVLNPVEAKELVDEYISTIANVLYNGSATDEDKEALKKSFGFESVETQYKAYKAKLNGAFGSDNPFNPSEMISRSADLSDWAKENKVTLDEIEKIRQKGYSAKSSIDELNNALNNLRNNTNDSSSKPKTFDSVWDSIGTTGDDDAKKKAKEEKKRLKELAEAGKLTEEELSNSSIAKEFTEAGVSIAKATKEINKFKSSASQLASMKIGISSISSILGEKKENQSSKNTYNNGIGADTLAGMPDDIKDQKKEYEHFVEVLGNGSSKMKDCRDAANQLATAYVNSNNFLSQLTDGTRDYYTSVLTEMGVENAAQVVQQALNSNKVDEILLNWDIVNATDAEIKAKVDEISKLDGANQALKDYAFQKALASKDALSTSASVSNLIALAEQCGFTGDALKELQELQILLNESTKISDSKTMTSFEKAARLGAISGQIATKQTDINNAANKKVKVKSADLNVNPKSTGSKDKSGKDKSSKTKESKQEINWLERRLARMQNIIDLTASKLQNLFSVKAKNNNLDKQIKQSTKLMNQYSIAAKNYQDKADSIAKGKKNGKKKTKPLSKSIIKKIKSGELTKKSYSDLIKEYDQNTADRIQDYINWYDKAQDAKKNKQDTKAKIRELQIQKWQNKQEDADNKISRYEAERENALLKNKNDTIKSQIDEVEKSYKAQIEIAKLERDTVKEAKLRAEKIKAINDLYQEEIDNIKAKADAKINELETGIVEKNGKRRTYGQQYYKNQVSLTEARGAIVDKQWYRMKSKIEDDKIKEAQAERNQLIAKIGNFADGTQGWYNLQSDIADCENVINDARIAQIENTKAMRVVTEAMEEKYDQWYSNFNSELSFLSSLQSGDHADSDSGTFTDSGNLALYTQALTFKSANAEKDYWRNQTTSLKGLIDKKASIEEIKNAGFEFESLEDAEKALDDYYQKWQDAISTEKSAEEAIIDLMKEKYEAQKDYLQDIVDYKRKSLETEKELYDYQKNIANKTKNVATLQKQINALRGDTSEEGRARLAKLQVSLDEAEQDLKDTEYERFISSQQNMLDNMMKQYEDLLTRLYKNRDNILADGLDYVNDNIKSLSSLLSTTAKTYDYTMTSGLDVINKSLGNGDDKSSVVGLLQSLPGKIIEEYKNIDSGKDSNNGGGDKGGGDENPNPSAPTNGGTTQQTQTKNGQTTVTPSAMDKIEGTSEKLRKLRDALNSMKGAGFEKYWTLKSGTPKSYINQRIAAEPNYDKVYPNGKRSPQILTEKGLKLLAKKLGVKYPSSGSVKTADLNKYVKDAGFSTGGIAHLVKSNGEDGLMMARNGEGFVSPEHVESIQKLLSIVPDMSKFTAELSNIPKFQHNNQPTSNSIGEVNFNMDINPENFPDFVNQLQNDQRVRQTFSVAVKDLMKSGKITSNIQRY